MTLCDQPVEIAEGFYVFENYDWLQNKCFLVMLILSARKQIRGYIYYGNWENFLLAKVFYKEFILV